MGVGAECHAAAALAPGKRAVLSGLLGLYGWVRKISHSLGFEIRTVHPIESPLNERKHNRDMRHSELLFDS
jgi:hypothetical protein